MTEAMASPDQTKFATRQLRPRSSTTADLLSEVSQNDDEVVCHDLSEARKLELNLKMRTLLRTMGEKQLKVKKCKKKLQKHTRWANKQQITHM